MIKEPAVIKTLEFLANKHEKVSRSDFLVKFVDIKKALKLSFPSMTPYQVSQNAAIAVAILCEIGVLRTWDFREGDNGIKEIFAVNSEVLVGCVRDSKT